MRWIRVVTAVAILTSCAGCSGDDATATPTATLLGFHVIATHPHDSTSFTEGLAFSDANHLLESSGHYEQSRVSIVDPETGTADKVRPLEAKYFGEGLTVVDDTVLQLTYKEGMAFRWTADSLEPAGWATYVGEGWGLAYDAKAKEIIQSDGTSVLRFRRPDTFEQKRTVEVTRAGKKVEKINELEWVDGALWANVWKTNDLLRIDPKTGHVTGVVDLTSIDEQLSVSDPDLVLNGIAHRPSDPPNRLWVTGKGFSLMTEIEIETAA